LVLFSMVPGKKCLPELVSNLGSVKPKTVGFTRIEHTHTQDCGLHQNWAYTHTQLIRASTQVLCMWSFIVKLMKKIQRLPVWLRKGNGPHDRHRSPWLVKGAASLCTCREKSVINMI
jgi:hypothetical protein